MRLFNMKFFKWRVLFFPFFKRSVALQISPVVALSPATMQYPLLPAPNPIILKHSQTVPARTCEERYMHKDMSSVSLALLAMLKYHETYQKIPSHLLLSEVRFLEFQEKRSLAPSLDTVHVQSSAVIGEDEVVCFIEEKRI